MNNTQFKSIIKKLYDTGFGHIFGSDVINKIISFVSGFILVRILSKTDYGVFSYAQNIYSLFYLLNGLGMTSSILQLCSENFKDKKKAKSFYAYGSIFGVIANVLMSLGILLWGLFLPLSVPNARITLMFMSFLPIFTIVHELIQVHFRYNLLNKKYSYYNTINVFLISMLSIIGGIYGGVNGLIIGRYFSYTISILIGIVIYKFPIKNYFDNITFPSVEDRYTQIKIAIISMMNIGTGQLLFLLDIFIIGLLISDTNSIASYKVATLIPNALLFIPSSLMVYTYPYFAKNNKDKIWVKRNYILITKYFGIFNLIITTGLVLLAPVIIKVIFGTQYLDAVPVFRLLALSYFFSATFRKVIGNILVTQRKLKVNFWIGIFEGILNIVINIVLVSKFGVIGAAITTLIIVILSSLISYIYINKYLKSR